MKKKFKNQAFAIRFKVSSKNGRRNLLINEIFYSKERRSFKDADTENEKGSLFILPAEKGLLEGLKNTHLDIYIKEVYRSKFKGEGFNTIVLNDVDGFFKASDNYELNNKKKI